MTPATPLYRQVYEDLRERIESGEFEVGARLPAINSLQEHYEVAGLNTIRQAQQMLVADGLIQTHQGVGAIVVSTEAVDQAVDVLHELRTARRALDRAITVLEHQSRG
ncbi:hypothetical protein GCM10009795_096770 [Nocardioides hankookensis]|uniref:Winged helix-turn-helix domain-containing protein n=1 Tax=Nocardioides hankookensis TaxID=443157 RepID=A0ABW1LLM1_9ACTN